MKLLIIGGSGILSTDFTKTALDQGNTVYIVNRGYRSDFIDKRAVLIRADIRNESLSCLIRKFSRDFYDVVIDFLSYNVEQMKKTLEAIQNNFTQYIFISSATAYINNSENRIITEKNPIGNKSWDYAYNKFLCEEFLKTQNIIYTIIRPYVTYGCSRIPFQIIPDGNNYTVIARIKQNKPIVLLDQGSAVCTLTHTIDFAKILCKLLLNEKAYYEDFHITSPFTYTWKEVYLELCEILNCKPNLLTVSLEKVKQYLPEYYSVLKGDKGNDMIFDNSKVINAIGGYEFAIDLNKGLSQSVEFFENHANMQNIDYKWEGEVDGYIHKEYKIRTKCIRNKERISKQYLPYYFYKYAILKKILFVFKKAKSFIRRK